VLLLAVTWRTSRWFAGLAAPHLGSLRLRF
jgi:hypothetical protein